jgi:hypothetical protein
MNDEPSTRSAGKTQDSVPGFPTKTLIAFIAISLVIGIAGYQYYLSEKARYSREVE